MTQQEEIKKNGDFVEIPVSVLRKAGLTVRAHDDLKGYVKNEDGVLKFPANTDYRFLTAARTTGATNILDIGGKDHSLQLASKVLKVIKNISEQYWSRMQKRLSPRSKLIIQSLKTLL